MHLIIHRNRIFNGNTIICALAEIPGRNTTFGLEPGLDKVIHIQQAKVGCVV